MVSNKKICFVIGSLGNGGAERVVSVLANKLVELGYNVSIILYYSDRVDYYIDKRVNLYVINCNLKNNVILRLLLRLKCLRRYIKSLNPDIIISFLTEINIYTIVSLLNINIPIIISERNDPYHDPKQKIVRLFRNVIYKFSSGIVYQTEDASLYFKKRLDNIPYKIIANPIMDNLPHPDLNNKRDKRIVTFCRLAEQKNIPLLIDAYSDLNINIQKDYILEIYGEGPLKEKLIGYISQKNLQDKIFIKGFSNNIHSKIINASLFVLTSNYEGISNSMLEALAIGLPVICTDCPVGGARLAIKNNYNGILVEVNNKNQLVENIEKVLNNQEFMYAISSHYLETRKKFSTDTIVKEWNDFIKMFL